MHAISSYQFRSYRGNRSPPHTNTQTGPITIHCATKLSVQCNNNRRQRSELQYLDEIIQAADDVLPWFLRPHLRFRIMFFRHLTATSVFTYLSWNSSSQGSVVKTTNSHRANLGSTPAGTHKSLVTAEGHPAEIFACSPVEFLSHVRATTLNSDVSWSTKTLWKADWLGTKKCQWQQTQLKAWWIVRCSCHRKK